jgi:hypothetical protein
MPSRPQRQPDTNNNKQTRTPGDQDTRTPGDTVLFYLLPSSLPLTYPTTVTRLLLSASTKLLRYPQGYIPKGFPINEAEAHLLPFPTPGTTTYRPEGGSFAVGRQTSGQQSLVRNKLEAASGQLLCVTKSSPIYHDAFLPSSRVFQCWNHGIKHQYDRDVAPIRG